MMQYIFYGLLAALSILTIYIYETGYFPEWAKCKESLFTQVFSGGCTPRDGFRDRTIILQEEGEDI